jgi:hypothetical protein
MALSIQANVIGMQFAAANTAANHRPPGDRQTRITDAAINVTSARCGTTATHSGKGGSEPSVARIQAAPQSPVPAQIKGSSRDRRNSVRLGRLERRSRITLAMSPRT